MNEDVDCKEKSQKPRYLAKFSASKIYHDSPAIGAYELGSPFFFKLGPYTTSGDALENIIDFKRQNNVSYDFLKTENPIVVLPENYSVFNYVNYNLSVIDMDPCRVDFSIGYRLFYRFLRSDIEIFEMNARKIPLLFEHLKQNLISISNKKIEFEKENSINLVAEVDDCLVSLSYSQPQKNHLDCDLIIEMLSRENNQFSLKSLVKNREFFDLWYFTDVNKSSYYGFDLALRFEQKQKSVSDFIKDFELI